VPDCVACHQSLREGAAFCGACGARQPAAVETPEAAARYREVLVRFLADGALDGAEQAQLDALRVRLGIGLATHGKLLAELEPESPPPASLRLSIDVATLRHLAVGARGLCRFRVENDGQLALDSVTLAARLDGEALPPLGGATIFPGRAGVLALPVTPTQPGFHELSGELTVVDLMGERSRYTFQDVHLRVGGAGPEVQVVNIDQSSARVVDNSRSSFGGAAESGGLVQAGDGDWQPLALRAVRDEGERRAAGSTNARRVEFAVKTEKATYQVTTTLAQGDLSTVYGGHVRGSSPPMAVAVKIADQTSDNDLLQHEARVLGMLTAEAGGPVIHFVPPRDQFRTGDGRLGSVFDHLDGFDLTAVRDRCRARGEPGLPPRHLVWVLRRAFAALGWAHKHGILHGNVDPAHILVRPHDHMLWLVDWCWAVVNPAQTGQGWKALNETYCAPEVRERGRPTPASDLYSLGKVAIHLVGGDPASKTLPDMDARLARFLRFLTVESQGGRAQDAWELYLQINKIREQIWGAHEFVALEL
jgi:predicted Ser/Thr protein kinase